MLNLTYQLLKLFAEGVLPATAVQSLAGAAFKDGWGSGDAVAEKLAELGSGGRRPSNVLRDLLRLSRRIGVAEVMPEPYAVRVPGPNGSHRNVNVFLPHEQAHMTITKDGVEKFRASDRDWQGGVGVAGLVQRWSADAGIDPARDVLAVGLHADGVSYTATQRVGQSRSAAVSAWNFFTPAADHARGQRFLFFAVSKSLLCNCGCEGFHTVDELNGVFAWSMEALRAGQAPLRRHDGTAFSTADRKARLRGRLACRAALLQVRGDWEWLVQAVRLRRYSAEHFCWMCSATHAGPLAYLDVSDTAPWRATLVTHEAYLEQLAREGHAPSKLFLAPGFRLEFISVDSMHTVDLGLFADAAGGLIWLEISNKSLHNSFSDGIAFINKELESYYSANPGLSPLHVTLPGVRPTDGGYPSLKAKVAACRHLGPFLQYLVRRHQFIGYQLEDERLAPYSGEYITLAVQLADRYVGFHRSCEMMPFNAADCQEQMLSFLSVYSQLRLLFRRHIPLAAQGAQPFGTRPKLHMADHLVRERIHLYGSPRHFWCYGDEDFVGLVKRICVQTRHPRTMESRIISKYRLYAALHAFALGVGLV